MTQPFWVHDRALSARWIRQLRRNVFECRRMGHGGGYWYPMGEAPQTFFEQVVMRLMALARPEADCAGAEYWMRIQPTDSGFPFHFDRDEAVRGEIVSPSWSSVLYLTDCGGRTIVMSATPSTVPVPLQCVAVTPKRGRYFVFRGDLLHGAIPAVPRPHPRIAFFVNWWTRKPKSASRDAALAMQRLSPRHVRMDLQPAGVEALDALEQWPLENIVGPRGWASFHSRILEGALR